VQPATGETTTKSADCGAILPTKSDEGQACVPQSPAIRGVSDAVHRVIRALLNHADHARGAVSSTEALDSGGRQAYDNSLGDSERGRPLEP